MRQNHTGAYVSLLSPGKTDYTACHPRKTTTYILHVLVVVSITTHTHDRRKSIGEKKQINEKKIKGRKKRRTTSETKKQRKAKEKKEKEKTRRAKKDKTRRGSKERKRE